MTWELFPEQSGADIRSGHRSGRPASFFLQHDDNDSAGGRTSRDPELPTMVEIRCPPTTLMGGSRCGVAGSGWR